MSTAGKPNGSCASSAGRRSTDFSEPDEGMSMEAWYARASGKPVVVWTAGRKPHPWTVYVAAAVHAELEDAVAALTEPRG
jgi:hypothetical protein